MAIQERILPAFPNPHHGYARHGSRVVALTIAHVGGGFWVEIFIFGCSRVNYTHLGCFGAQGEVGGGAKLFDNGVPSVWVSQLGRWCHLGLLGLWIATRLIGHGFS